MPAGSAILRFPIDTSGNVQKAQGHFLPEALTSHQAALAIAEQLTRFDPGNAIWQRDLSLSYGSIGGLQVAQGHLLDAFRSYRASLAITEQLIKLDTSDAGSKHDLQFTVKMFGNLSYDLLLRAEFAKALEATTIAIYYAPTDILLYTNRAHALMFLDRTQEARALYLQFRGENDVQGGKSWTTLILADFAELRKAGLSRPLMDEIEQQFER